MATVQSNPSGLTRRQKYELLRAQLEIVKASFLAHWRDLADYIMPRRARFTVSDSNKGDRRNLKIIDSTATFSARTLAYGMMSRITNPARIWFKLTTPDQQLAKLPAVKSWLEEVSDRMRTVLLRSNFYSVLPTIYLDMGIFATAAMMMEEDDEEVIRCYPFPIGSYLIATDSKGRVRTFVREYQMTVQQMADKFGLDQLSPTSKALWDQNHRQTEVAVVHVISTNEQYDVTKMESKFLPFAGCYYERSSTDIGDSFLEERGFHEFPLMVPRWAVTAGDAWGTDSPGMMSLGDVKQLQQGEKTGAQGLEKMVKPPMKAPPAMRTTKASILPGDITYDPSPTGTPGFTPVHEVKINLQDLEYKQDRVRGRIQRCYFEDLFMMNVYNDQQQGTQPMTAAEVQARVQEQMLALGPVVSQCDKGLYDPGMERVFGIMLRRGMIPPPPAELQGSDLKVEYLSILHDAQKAASLGQVDRFLAIVSQMAQIDPSALDKLDIDESIDIYADMSGVPPAMVRTDDDVAALRVQRQRMQQAAQATALAEQASTAAKNLSQADTSGKNALTDVLSNAGAAAQNGAAQ